MKNTVSYFKQQGHMGIPKAQAEKIIKQHPDIIQYCHNNFWKHTCPDCCPHYEFCRSLDWEDSKGVYPIYPLNYYKEA